MNENNKFLYYSDECPLLPELAPFDTVDLFPNNDEVMGLSKMVEQLNIEVNTQNLKVELEKLKHQRLGTTLKRIRRETTPFPDSA